MDLKLVPLYFFVGGAIVTLVTYFGSQANKGALAAFIAFFPALTVITLCTIYWSGGAESAVSYAKSLVYLLPAWLLYIAAVIYLTPRLGLWPPLIIGVILYTLASYLTVRIMHLK
ncbi:MAG: DUF3147 domain-containing protein [Dehalococcoidia bacterium]|nr:DUF3147 domain-containing protein [Dehalococcoidia bacterium]